MSIRTQAWDSYKAAKNSLAAVLTTQQVNSIVQKRKEIWYKSAQEVKEFLNEGFFLSFFIF
jgi:hypothetical protein